MVSFSSRGGKKTITHVLGLENMPLKGEMTLKEAAKALGKRFAGATSIKDTPSGEKEIQIQGDWRYDIKEVLEQLCGVKPSKVTVDEDSGKRKPKEPKPIAPQPGRGP